MDPLIPVVVAIVGLTAVVALQFRFIARLVAAQTLERHAWATERWELNTRFQAPQIASSIPPPKLPSERPAETPPSVNDETAKAFAAVGTIV